MQLTTNYMQNAKISFHLPRGASQELQNVRHCCHVDFDGAGDLCRSTPL